MFAFLFFVICVASAGKLPDNFQVCKRSDNDLNGCLKKAMEKALVQMKDGVPDLNIPSFDPLKIDSLAFQAGSGSFSVDQKYKNLKIFGLSQAKIDKAELQIDDGKFKFSTRAVAPTCRLESDYDFKGRIMMLPIDGTGKSVVNMKQIEGIVTSTGEIVEKDGDTYVKIDDVKVEINPKDADFAFENLFSQDEALGKEMGKIINENWRELFNEVKHGYEEALGQAFKNVVANLFSNVPLKQLLPE